MSRGGLGAFWCERAAFEAVGGFDEKLAMAEDVDFAKRLRVELDRLKEQVLNVE